LAPIICFSDVEFPLEEQAKESYSKAITRLLRMAYLRGGDTNNTFESTVYTTSLEPTANTVIKTNIDYITGRRVTSEFINWTYNQRAETNTYKYAILPLSIDTNSMVNSDIRSLSKLDNRLLNLVPKYIHTKVVDNWDEIKNEVMYDVYKWRNPRGSWVLEEKRKLTSMPICHIGNTRYLLDPGFYEYGNVLFTENLFINARWDTYSDDIYSSVFYKEDPNYGLCLVWTNKEGRIDTWPGYLLDQTNQETVHSYYEYIKELYVKDYPLIYPARAMGDEVILGTYEYRPWPCKNDVVHTYPTEFLFIRSSESEEGGYITNKYTFQGYADYDDWWVGVYTAPYYSSSEIGAPDFMFYDFSTLDEKYNYFPYPYVGHVWNTLSAYFVRLGSTLRQGPYVSWGMPTDKIKPGKHPCTHGVNDWGHPVNFTSFMIFPTNESKWRTECRWTFHQGEHVIGFKDIMSPDDVIIPEFRKVPGPNHSGWTAFSDDLTYKYICNYDSGCLPWSNSWTTESLSFGGGLPTLTKPIVNCVCWTGDVPWHSSVPFVDPRQNKAVRSGYTKTYNTYIHTNIPNINDKIELVWTNPANVYGFFTDPELSWFEGGVADMGRLRTKVYPEALNARYWLLSQIKYIDSSPCVEYTEYASGTVWTNICVYHRNPPYPIDCDDYHCSWGRNAIGIPTPTHISDSGVTDPYYAGYWNTRINLYIDVGGTCDEGSGECVPDPKDPEGSICTNIATDYITYRASKYRPAHVCSRLLFNTNSTTPPVFTDEDWVGTIDYTLGQPESVLLFQKRSSWTYYSPFPADISKPYMIDQHPSSSRPPLRYSNCGGHPVETPHILDSDPVYATHWPETHDECMKFISEEPFHMSGAIHDSMSDPENPDIVYRSWYYAHLHSYVEDRFTKNGAPPTTDTGYFHCTDDPHTIYPARGGGAQDYVRLILKYDFESIYDNIFDDEYD
jgi:hypothetical protein